MTRTQPPPAMQPKNRQARWPTSRISTSPWKTMTSKGTDPRLDGETAPQAKSAGFLARGMALSIDLLLINILYFGCLCAVAASLLAHSPHWLVLIPSILFGLLL